MNFIISKNINILSNFLNNAGNSLDTFTFYNTRDLEYIEKIDIVVWGEVDGNIISYGHLDFSEKDSDRWVGLCVSQNYRGQGYGKKILEELELEAKNKSIKKLKLTVHKNNIAAIKLYEKNNFKIFNENDKSFFMEKGL